MQKTYADMALKTVHSPQRVRCHFLVCLAALIGSACAKRTTSVPLVDGLVAGCTSVLSGPRCLYVRGSTVTLWIAVQNDDLALNVDGAPTSAKGRAAGNGIRFETVLRAEHHSIEVRGALARFEVELHLVNTSSPSEAPARRAFELHQRGRRALANGDVDNARQLLLEALTLAQTASDGHTERGVVVLLTYIDVQILGLLSDAENRLEAVRQPPLEDGLDRVALALVRGQLASKLLDWSTADREFDVAATLGGSSFGRYGSGARSDRALMHLAVGDLPRALALWERLLSTELDPCIRSLASANIGWARTLEGGQLEDAERHLLAALEGYESTCPRTVMADTQRINLAWLELERGRGDAALRRIEGLRSPSGQLEAWTGLVRARAHRMEGRLQEAARGFAALKTRATSMRDTELMWMAHVGEARVAVDQGDLERAVPPLEAAELLLSSNHARVPLTTGHFGLLSVRADSGRLLVETLARLERFEDALAALDRIQARARRPLELHAAIARLGPQKRAAWTAAMQAHIEARGNLDLHMAKAWSSREPLALRRSKEDELSAAVDRALDALAGVLDGRSASTDYQLHPPKGVATVAQVGERLFVATAATLQVLDATTVLQWWTSLKAADRPRLVRLVSERPKDAVELLSATRFQVPVVLAGRVATSTRTVKRSGDVLIVADPSRNLSSARKEGREVHDAVGYGQLLVGQDATRDALRRALPSARLFHFAGHGRWAGFSGWGSTLALADGPLLVSDVLLLSSPSIVVLSGCTTAGNSLQTSAAGMSVARAFLASGADYVIATHRDIDSKVARTFAQHLYSADADLSSPADAYLSAVRALEEKGVDWDAFVLLE